MNTLNKSMSIRFVLSAFILTFTLNACAQNAPSTEAKMLEKQVVQAEGETWETDLNKAIGLSYETKKPIMILIP